ncbi:hypothetical protein CAPTEDRAFT_160234 [Capitella teleta]|uniref:Uncharacterized protein n=1 Tax=Capitella teleta TaxID=283909 RepID=R7U353_CAPTE|nr:hypothetical protein CAPTEDRAFT_160234 [Capitella teleta]|eukprot:ELT98106.1 hypothetical protein CAPTEDRAFT_160234 [Capitella teleta]
MLCIQKGFPWPHVCAAFTMADEMLQGCKGKPLTYAIMLYKEKCSQYLKSLSEKNLNIFTTHFFSSFMQHYSLMQFVFMQNREKLTIRLSQSVETSEPPLAFKEGKEVDIYEYEQKIKQIEVLEKQCEDERLNSEKEAKQDKERRIQEIEEKLEQLEVPLEREQLVELINDIAASHLSVTSASLQSQILKTRDEVTFMLEKTIVPRPAALGIPPRYKTKSSLGKHPKSAKDAPKQRSSSKLRK